LPSNIKIINPKSFSKKPPKNKKPNKLQKSEKKAKENK